MSNEATKESQLLNEIDLETQEEANNSSNDIETKKWSSLVQEQDQKYGIKAFGKNAMKIYQQMKQLKIWQTQVYNLKKFIQIQKKNIQKTKI